MDFLSLTKDKLVVSDLSDLVAHESCGAISLFVGTTRDNFEDKKVISLEYEAYEPMALKTLKKICGDIRTRWPDVKNIAIHHRLGEVPVKEASVVIAISSPHRKDGIDATAFAIEELKKQVPIWKKEQYTESQAKRKPTVKINFQACPVVGAEVPKHLIQINANHEEVTRRISMFIEKKREEVNTSNIEDFIEKDTVDSCARVKSAVFRVKDSKGHLKVRRVINEYGPQTQQEDYTKVFKKLNERGNENGLGGKVDPENCRNFGISERLKSMENHLKISPSDSEDIFKRIKGLEARILYLESISPEYMHFLEKTTLPKSKVNPHEGTRKRKYTIRNIDEFINELEEI